MIYCHKKAFRGTLLYVVLLLNVKHQACSIFGTEVLKYAWVLSLLQIFVNTFSITDHECHTLGVGLYLGASIFDHSCDPMAVANFDGTTIYIRNIKSIPKTLPVCWIDLQFTSILHQHVVFVMCRLMFMFLAS